MRKKRRSFSKEFKLEAVRLVIDGGISIAQVARDLGIYGLIAIIVFITPVLVGYVYEIGRGALKWD